VTRHKNKRVIENIVGRDINGKIYGIDVYIRIFVQEPEHVRLFGLAIIPIAAALIF